MEDPRQEVKKIRWEKLKKVASMAAPMVVVNISRYLLRAISTMIVGHKSEISLAGIALASTLASVTGFTLIVRRASADPKKKNWFMECLD
uniref:MATE efflux family protein 5 n=1 Tax=Noccaea caerulescens TaxID=107243 RepID=A0A1J3GGZ5_NOCCA